MNVARLTYSVLRLSRPFRLTPPCKPVVLCRFAHQKTIKKVQQKTVKDEPKRPINDDIPLEVVQLANADGKLEPPEPLADVLARLDLTRFYLELVAPDKSVVKIYDKKEEREKDKARRKAGRARMRANEHKEIQMTWGVAQGDLTHKLEKARKELGKQNRVDLIFAPKAKQPLPPPAVRDGKIDEVLEILKDVGAEWMPRTFKRSLLTVHLRAVINNDI